MSSFWRPKAEVHTISSDEEFVDSQGRKYSQLPPALPPPPLRNYDKYTIHVDFWESQTVDCLKHQLRLRNSAFKEEDRMKSKNRAYNDLLCWWVQDEKVQGGWGDPVFVEMFEHRRFELAFRTRNKSKRQSLSSSVGEVAAEGGNVAVKGGESVAKNVFGV